MGTFAIVSIVLGVLAGAAGGGAAYKIAKDKAGKESNVPKIAGVAAGVGAAALVYTFWWLLIPGAAAGWYMLNKRKALPEKTGD